MVTVIAVVAAKGGVGKSTIAANLGTALCQTGRAILSIDLDPQNALHLHLGGNPEDIHGLSRASVGGTPWRNACVRSVSGVYVLPFGQVNDTDLQTLERQIASDPNWLSNHLRSLNLNSDTVVILDTPPGSSEYLRQALGAADLVISVLLADAASYPTLPMIENMIQRYSGARPGRLGHVCIVNQVDAARLLSKDSVHLIQSALGDRVIGVVHEDQAVSESLARGRTVVEADPYSLGRKDLMQCADWILRRLKTRADAAL
ncbi:cellulose biosynthesis protein BcsQ [Bordetella sp. FB-8]|uniref:cellulose biosynthesis protein BcsQ n=1 Tax=Bordetella sp. FB-8 TaxID=1159870 RepID=UPI00036AC361|nr:cellulose biosynthesis protein BcsQ [Bordetella sp. FB-8]